MNKYNGNPTPTENQDAARDSSSSGDRRRLGRIVHDDRGAASVEWWDAPEGHERPVFRIEGEEPLAILKDEDTFNPYERKPDTAATLGGKPAKGSKRDLKKLSEWLKLMREMEERKSREEE